MYWIIKDYKFISYFLNSNIGYWLQILRLIFGFSGILPHNGGVVLNIDGSSLPVILDSQILVKLFEMKILILILSKRNPWHGLNQLWFRGIRQNNCYSDSLEVIFLTLQSISNFFIRMLLLPRFTTNSALSGMYPSSISIMKEIRVQTWASKPQISFQISLIFHEIHTFVIFPSHPTSFQA